MPKTQILSYTYNHQTLTIEWGDHHHSTFHYIWLRDNAPENRHANGQKLTDTVDVPLDITVKAIIITNTVRIEWADDKTSEFEPAWLRAHAYEPGAVAGRRQQPQLWTANDIVAALPEFSYPALTAQDDRLRDMLAAVRDLGFALIHEVPAESEALFKVVKLFGYVRETNYGPYFDVKVAPNPTNLAYTGLTLNGHTDKPYRHPVPTLQLLHVLHNAVEGGDNTLVDGFCVAEALRQAAPDKFALLTTAPVTFRFCSDEADLQYESTIIETDVWGAVSGIRFNNRSMQAFYLPPDQMEAFYAAYQTFGHMLEAETYKITFKLEAGDLMLFDNQRILHGRIGYTSSGQRHLQGCYADRDSLLSKLAVLSRSQIEGATG
jgi:gamma-butyrobetaine dioxygenase